MDQMLIERLIETLDDLRKTLQELRGETDPELKPCPFCGGEYVIKKLILSARFIRCDSCSAETTWFPTKQEAIEAWNRRA